MVSKCWKAYVINHSIPVPEDGTPGVACPGSVTLETWCPSRTGCLGWSAPSPPTSGAKAASPTFPEHGSCLLTICRLGCDLALPCFPKESHYLPPAQSVVSQSIFLLKRNYNRRAFPGCQVAHLALQSSGDLGGLNLALSFVCSYTSLSHYLIGITLDLCWYSCAVQSWTLHIFPRSSVTCAG